jgi:hypothetical protein
MRSVICPKFFCVTVITPTYLLTGLPFHETRQSESAEEQLQ